MESKQLALSLVEGTPTYLGLVHKAFIGGCNEEEIIESLKRGLQKRANFWDRKADYEHRISGESTLYRILTGRANKNRELSSILEEKKLEEYMKSILFHSGCRYQ